MKKIIYSGFYGFKNTGDDVFLEVAAWASKAIFNAKECVFLGHDLPELVNTSRGLSKPLFKGHNRIQGALEVKNADYFISAGGSTFSRHKKNSYKEIAEYSKFFCNSKLKTGAIGVSIGPFKSIQDEKNVVTYLQKLDFLALRDRRSFDFVSQLNLPYKPVEAFDLAALLPLVYQGVDFKVPKSEKKIIGISICPVESISNPDQIAREIERKNKMVVLIKKLNKYFKDTIIFRFFIINGNPNIGDEKITREVIELAKITNFDIVPYQSSVFEAWKAIKECDFMIATRLHAGIIAAYAGVPFILNEYHQKCTDFVEGIKLQQEFVVGDAQFEYDSLLLSIDRVLQDKNTFLLSNIRHTQDLAMKNFRFNELS